MRKDGSRFWAEVVTTALRDAGGELIGFVKIDKDITSRRSAAEQIQKLNAQLTQRVDELGGANLELESFSYSVSHDLRSPLRHMDGFARILKEEHSANMAAEAIRYLDRILTAATHMGQLLDDLLNLAKIGRLELRRERAQIAVLVKQAIAELPTEAQERNIEWWVEPLPELNCDARLLKLIFTNLLSNAVKFTRKQANAVIEAGSRVRDGQPIIFVRDNGVGFDMQYADKLFGVFQRLHRQEDCEGTGVGLATVQRIVRRHGGEIWAESQPNSGTTFFSRSARGRKLPAKSGRRSSNVLERETVEILLVEDNLADAELALHALKKSKVANHVLHVRDGAEALDYLFCRGEFAKRDEGVRPVLVLLDLKPPKVDGLQVLKQIKSEARTKAIPVILLTSSKEESDMANGYQLGVNSYIQKPVHFGEFQEVLR